jgi:pyruvate dehydrogenase E1 component
MNDSPSDVAGAASNSEAASGATSNGVASNGAGANGAAVNGTASGLNGSANHNANNLNGAVAAQPTGTQDEQQETQEWLDSLDYVLQSGGPERVQELLRELEVYAQRQGVCIPFAATTPYINTIAPQNQAPFPGDREMERRIKSLVRWNAMAMVIRGNKVADPGRRQRRRPHRDLRFAATLFEIGFNHFFKAKNGESSGDQVYFQGHASPGVYARAFLEGRLTEEKLINFRRELEPGGG